MKAKKEKKASGKLNNIQREDAIVWILKTKWIETNASELCGIEYQYWKCICRQNVASSEMYWEK